MVSMQLQLRYVERHNSYFLLPKSPEAKKLAKKHGFISHATGAYCTNNPAALFKLIKLAQDKKTRIKIKKLKQRFDLSWSDGNDCDPLWLELTHETPEGKVYSNYQKVAINLSLDQPFTLIADEQGTGKMIEGCGIINEMGPEDDNKYLIICPSVGKYTWEDELRDWSVYDWKINVCEGLGTAKKSVMFDPEAQVNIMNYDLMMANKEAVMKCNFKAIIFDEFHEIKNPKAGRSQTALGYFRKPGFISRAQHVIATTGTPIENRPMEFYGTLHRMAPHVLFPHVKYLDYGKRFCAGHKRVFGWNMMGSSNERELNARLRSTIMVRRLKLDSEDGDGVFRPGVQNELPERLYQLVPLKIETDRPAAKMLEIDGSYDFDDLRKSLKNLKDMSAGEQAAYRQQIALLKLPYTIKWIKAQMLEHDKIVIFAHHKKVISKLMDEFREHNPVALTGNTSSINKRKWAKKFQENPDCKLFFGQIKSAGVLITLTVCHRIIFAEPDWVPGKIAQAIDRCHRRGQKNSVLSQFLVIKGSIEERMVRICIEKQRDLDAILN